MLMKLWSVKAASNSVLLSSCPISSYISLPGFCAHKPTWHMPPLPPCTTRLCSDSKSTVRSAPTCNQHHVSSSSMHRSCNRNQQL
jgi:hypothetical protein